MSGHAVWCGHVVQIKGPFYIIYISFLVWYLGCLREVMIRRAIDEREH